MTFLTFVGGVIVFGLLWLLLPRASFMVTLTMLLTQCYGVILFANTTASPNVWENIASTLIILGFLIGGFLDIGECLNTFLNIKEHFNTWNPPND